jgi:formylglycine-generating enzyme required for sulfatase activity
MAGNVWEWVMDWYSSYSSASSRNPTGPESGTYRVLRGGSWLYYDLGYLRVADRYYYEPDGRSVNVGFRCANSP